jgi:hypothetical protein
MNESRGTYHRRRSFSDDDPHAALASSIQQNNAAAVAAANAAINNNANNNYLGVGARSSGTFSHPSGASLSIMGHGSPSLSPSATPSTPVERLMRSALTGMPPTPTTGNNAATIASGRPHVGGNNSRQQRRRGSDIDPSDISGEVSEIVIVHYLSFVCFTFSLSLLTFVHYDDDIG